MDKLACGGIGYCIEVRLEVTSGDVSQEIFVDVIKRNATRRDLPYSDPGRVEVRVILKDKKASSGLERKGDMYCIVLLI
jgi:hypothetical protein